MSQERPLCEYLDCTNLAHYSGKRKNGTKTYRRRNGIGYVCNKHHRELTPGDKDWMWNGKPYLRHRKDYCENMDSRLGFSCTATIIEPFIWILTVDHIDGNHFNNDESNLQTLCHNCHNYKTNKNGDNLKRYSQ